MREVAAHVTLCACITSGYEECDTETAPLPIPVTLSNKCMSDNQISIASLLGLCISTFV